MRKVILPLLGLLVVGGAFALGFSYRSTGSSTPTTSESEKPVATSTDPYRIPESLESAPTEKWKLDSSLIIPVSGTSEPMEVVDPVMKSIIETHFKKEAHWEKHTPGEQKK